MSIVLRVGSPTDTDVTVVNHGFEDGDLTGWAVNSTPTTREIVETPVHSGTYALHHVGDSQYDGSYQVISCGGVAGGLTLTVWANCTTQNDDLRIGLTWTDNGGAHTETKALTANSAYTQYTVSGTAVGAITACTIILYGNGEAYFDDVILTRNNTGISLWPGSLTTSSTNQRKGSCEFEIRTASNLDDLAIAVGKPVYLETGAGVRVWGGFIERVTATGVNVIETALHINVSCTDWSSILDRRTATIEYTNQTVGYIVGNLIQNCHLGPAAEPFDHDGIVANIPEDEEENAKASIVISGGDPMLFGSSYIGNFDTVISYIKADEGAISGLFDEICDATGMIWYLNPDRHLIMIDKDDFTATAINSTSAHNIRNVTYTAHRRDYANHGHYTYSRIVTNLSGGDLTATYAGDDETTSWDSSFPIHSVTDISVGGVTRRYKRSDEGTADDPLVLASGVNPKRIGYYEATAGLNKFLNPDDIVTGGTIVYAASSASSNNDTVISLWGRLHGETFMRRSQVTLSGTGASNFAGTHDVIYAVESDTPINDTVSIYIIFGTQFEMIELNPAVQEAGILYVTRDDYHATVYGWHTPDAITDGYTAEIGIEGTDESDAIEYGVIDLGLAPGSADDAEVENAEVHFKQISKIYAGNVSEDTFIYINAYNEIVWIYEDNRIYNPEGASPLPTGESYLLEYNGLSPDSGTVTAVASEAIIAGEIRTLEGDPSSGLFECTSVDALPGHMTLAQAQTLAMSRLSRRYSFSKEFVFNTFLSTYSTGQQIEITWAKFGLVAETFFIESIDGQMTLAHDGSATYEMDYTVTCSQSSRYKSWSDYWSAS